METTLNLSLPLIMPSQAQKHVTHNEALIRLDGMVQLAVRDRDLTTPPAAPVEGDRYIVAGSGIGEWSGHGGKIAQRHDGTWLFVQPAAGWIAYVVDEAMMAYLDRKRLGAGFAGTWYQGTDRHPYDQRSCGVSVGAEPERRCERPGRTRRGPLRRN